MYCSTGQYVFSIRICTAVRIFGSEYCSIYGVYTTGYTDDFDDARKWWLLQEQQRDYPNLSRMALDILSIPAMSASIERLFSFANIEV